MKQKIILSFFITLLSIIVSGQEQDNFTNEEVGVFKLYPTQNVWAFIKLNTSNGKMWQVHFSLNEDEGGTVVLNSIPLNVGVLSDNESAINGRFALFPTENIYNFLLLDQLEGTIWQVQWSLEEENRGIIKAL